MSWPFEPFHPMSYDVILADPPWSFDLWSGKGNAKSPAAHYDVMSFEDIASLPVSSLGRERLGERDWIEGQIMLGHRPQSRSSDVYAPYQAGYLGRAKAVTEEIIEAIESLCPNAFHRSNTGAVALVRVRN